MLLLKPKHQTRTVTHAESGARFTIRSLSPSKREAIRARHVRGSDVRLIPYMEDMAVFVIVGWEDVGDDGAPAQCTEDNRAAFGRAHALNVMPWLLSESESLEQFLSDEREAAKND